MIIKKRIEKKEQENNVKKTSEHLKFGEEKVDLFDLDNINFSQRQERRRGNRRRGYRRIDDRNLISRAQEEAGDIRDNAAIEGYKAGIEKAQNDIESLKNSMGEFLNAKQEVFEYIAPDILEISIDIAKKIVKHEIELHPDLVLESIKEVLKTLSKDEPKIIIKVNPSQNVLVKENIPEITSSIGIEAKINILSDDTIELGSCIIQTNNGIVDATINTRLEIIKETFKGI